MYANITVTAYTYVDSVQVGMHWFLFLSFFAYTPKTRAYGKKSLEVQDSMQAPPNLKTPSVLYSYCTSMTRRGVWVQFGVFSWFSVSPWGLERPFWWEGAAARAAVLGGEGRRRGNWERVLAWLHPNRYVHGERLASARWLSAERQPWGRGRNINSDNRCNLSAKLL